MAGAVTPCWMCGDLADSREHIFKASDLRRLFDADGYDPDDLPFHFTKNGFRRIRGPKSHRMKYPNSLCQKCNGDRTSLYDRAYDAFSNWCARNQSDDMLEEIFLADVFGPNVDVGVERFRRHCAKSLGCRIINAECLLPDGFPNPLSGAGMDRLQISLCRLERFRNLRNYRSALGDRILSKGQLYANISRSRRQTTGEKKVYNAVWWEGIGHFQISYWLDIAVAPQLGPVLQQGIDRLLLMKSAFDEGELQHFMSSWIANNPKQRPMQEEKKAEVGGRLG